MKRLLAVLLLLAGPAAAQNTVLPPAPAHGLFDTGPASAGGATPVLVQPSPVASVPSGFSAAFTTSPTVALAAGNRSRVNFVVQGTGNGCYSFTSAAPTITGSTCTNGYPVTGGSSFASSIAAVPNTALTIVEASGAALTIYGDVQ